MYKRQGEESRRQLKLRAQRLGVSDGDIYVLGETQVSESLAVAEDLKPTVVIIDSIQTMFDAEVSATPGSVSQVRESTMAIMRRAKSDGFTAFVVGHINKAVSYTHLDVYKRQRVDRLRAVLEYPARLPQ